MKRYKAYQLIITTLLIILFASCSRKMDDYKDKYLTEGVLKYAGKIDSLKIYSGKDRVLVSGLIISDPNIVSATIYWNNRADSMRVPISRTNGIDTINQYITRVSEGTHSFEVVTSDMYGHRSVSVFHAGTVYGNRYQQLLNNRVVLSALSIPDSTTIDWNVADQTIVGVELKYTDNSNNEKTIFLPASQNQTVLKDFKFGASQYTYRTLYKPTVDAIDTFYTAYETKKVAQDVTSVYINNPGYPFLRADANGARFGNPLGWTSSSQTKNMDVGGVKYGGFDSYNSGGYLSVERWGQAQITNARIYQSNTLPAGKYSFEAYFTGAGAGIGGTDNDRKYIIVALTNDIPAVYNVTNTTLANKAIGYAPFKNGSTVVKVPFTLDAETQVAYGIAVEYLSDQQWYRCHHVKLYKLE